MQNINQIQQTMHSPDMGQQVRRQIENEGTEGFAKLLESVLIQQMLKQMNSSMLSEGPFGKSNQAKIFQGMFTESMAEQIANSGGIGLSSIITQQFDEVKPATESTRWDLMRTRKLSMFNETLKAKMDSSYTSEEGNIKND
ncbi:MAG: hypothetical protein GF372_14805 [Candidatus Marinimicrobia bacterium]|nr:hypothetical protein [Candidatus Neomarinimicrobiota bacterium]